MLIRYCNACGDHITTANRSNDPDLCITHWKRWKRICANQLWRRKHRVRDEVDREAAMYRWAYAENIKAKERA